MLTNEEYWELRSYVKDEIYGEELKEVLLRIVDGLKESDTPEEPKPSWPPVGMPIEVKLGNEWYVRISAGYGAYYDGGVAAGETIYFCTLNDIEWRYLKAPVRWPEGAKSWIAMSNGSYVWTVFHAYKGDVDNSVGGTVLYAEHRTTN